MRDLLNYLLITVLIVLGGVFLINEMRILKDSPQPKNYNGYFPIELENLIQPLTNGYFHNERQSLGQYFLDGVNLNDDDTYLLYDVIWSDYEDYYYPTKIDYVYIQKSGGIITVNVFRYNVVSTYDYLEANIYGISNYEVIP
jgi:hypothetical protein